MKFTKIPSDAFQKLQINAGILTTDFTPSTGAVGEAGQIGATTSRTRTLMISGLWAITPTRMAKPTAALSLSS